MQNRCLQRIRLEKVHHGFPHQENPQCQKKGVAQIKREEYISKSVLCPFYKRESAQEIKCEGFGEGMTNHTAFAEKAHKREYRAQVCSKDYESCRLYKALEENDEQVQE